MKSQVKFWTATNTKLWKLIIPISAKLNFLSSYEMPTKLNNYYKKPILIFAPYNFLIFLDTQLHEPRNIRKDHFWIFWKWCFSFSGEILGSFLLTPPNSRSSKFNSPPPHPPGRSELVSDWLKFTRAWVKTLLRLLFRISIMVCVCGGGEGGS